MSTSFIIVMAYTSKVDTKKHGKQDLPSNLEALQFINSDQISRCMPLSENNLLTWVDRLDKI